MTTATLPALIIHPHPLLGDGTTMQTAAFRLRETLAAYIERNHIHLPRGPVWVLHNGRKVPASLWPNLIPREGDQVIIRAAVQGGGDNKVLSSVAMIALVIATNGAFGWQGLGAMLGTATGMGTGLASAIIMIGGTMAIAPILPIPEAK